MKVLTYVVNRGREKGKLNSLQTCANNAFSGWKGITRK
jgi:hypothetical protein